MRTARSRSCRLSRPARSTRWRSRRSRWPTRTRHQGARRVARRSTRPSRAAPSAATTSWGASSKLGSSALTEIHDDSKIDVWFTVPDRVMLEFAARGQQGQPAALDQLPPVELAREVDDGFQGRVDYVDPEVDIETDAADPRRVRQPDGYSGGFFARVRLRTGEIPGALIVPEVALGRTSGAVPPRRRRGDGRRRAVQIGTGPRGWSSAPGSRPTTR